MVNCYYCNLTIGDLPYRCKFCGMLFCKKHRIPENHDCPFDLIQKPVSSDKEQESYILYQDALDFMSYNPTLENILDYIKNSKFSNKQTCKVLNAFIENSEEVEIRKNCLLAIKLLNIMDDEAFKILEYCLISDSNPQVRHIAAKVLIDNFPERSKGPIKWALEHDKELNLK